MANASSGLGRSSNDAGRAETVGRFLRWHRGALGLTQTRLAAQARISVATIRDLEQGRTLRPRAHSLDGLADALGVPREEFRRVLDGGELPVPGEDIPPSRVSIKALGPLTVWRDGRQVPVGSRTQRIILARLALAPGEVVTRGELVDLLWGGGSQPDASARLSSHVLRLRRHLEIADERIIVATGPGYTLDLGADRLDVVRFRWLVEQAGGTERFEMLREAVGLWRGSSDVDELLGTPALTQVEAEYVSAVHDFAAAANECGRSVIALPTLRVLAARNELDEAIHALLIDALAATGRQAEALSVYADLRHRLADELGVDPSSILQKAFMAVLQRRPEAAASNVSALGVPRQLPAGPQLLVGREQQMRDLVDHLTRPSHHPRVALISGPAGVGKTALALSACRRATARYPDGQLYADLHAGSEGDAISSGSVLTRFLRALGIPPSRSGTTVEERSALLRSELARRSMLLVLDNVVDASQVLALLPGSGGSDVLVTSRRRLPEVITTHAVELTAVGPRASRSLIAAVIGSDRVDAEPSAVDELISACDGLPLALRIVASRLASRPMWSIATMARRLRDENSRLAEMSVGEVSVAATLQEAYADLSERARRVLSACAVHPGQDVDVDLTAVLLGSGQAEAEGGLEELLDASMMVQHAEGRYQMHDLVRLFAQRLPEQGEAPTAAPERVVDWYVERVRSAIDHLYFGSLRLQRPGRPSDLFADHSAASAWLEREVATAVVIAERAATDPATRHGTWQLADGLRSYFLMRGGPEAWERIAAAGLAAARAGGDVEAEAMMLLCRSQAMNAAGRDEEFLRDAQACATLSRENGWNRIAAYVSYMVGWFKFETGLFDAAGHWFSRARQGAADPRSAGVLATIRNGQGMLSLQQGRFEEAAAHFTAAMALNESLGRAGSLRTNRGNLASAVRLMGRTDDAESMLQDLLEEHAESDEWRGELSTLDELSRLERDRGNLVEAVRLAVRANAIAARSQDPRAAAMVAGTLARAQTQAGECAEGAEVARTALDHALTHDYRYEECRARVALAVALIGLGDLESAGAEVAQATGLAERHAYPRLLEECAGLARRLERPAGEGRPADEHPQDPLGPGHLV